MESDALREAFQTSIEKCGLIYKKFVEDGDSSVYKSILDSNPYEEYDLQVQKYECTNHLTKNAYKRLQKVVDTRDPLETRGDGRLQARQLLGQNIVNIMEEIEDAAHRRREQDISKEEKADLLLQDINNVVSHIFGEHADCKPLNWPCAEEIRKDEENFLPLLRNTIYHGIVKAMEGLRKNVVSLLKNATTNNCEWFNNHICKCIGSKRICFGKHQSYAGRCQLQVLQSTKKGIISVVYKELNKNVPEVVTTMERNRQLQVEINRINESNRRKNG